jgi:hypothetical protein
MHTLTTRRLGGTDMEIPRIIEKTGPGSGPALPR